MTDQALPAYPAPDWDVAYALTLGREPVNPRPLRLSWWGGTGSVSHVPLQMHFTGLDHAEQHAMSSARVIPTCAMMGQAAGIAAALCARQAVNPRALNPLAVKKIVQDRGADLAVDSENYIMNSGCGSAGRNYWSLERNRR